jgi:hypothetical protein
LLTPPLRPNRKQTKKAFELIDIRWKQKYTQ